MKSIQQLRSSMAVNIIGAIVLLLVILGVILSTMGLVSFTEAFKKEYATTTYHMADTAATLVNGDHLEDYLAGNETEEYRRTEKLLDSFCYRMNVSLVYVICVDQSDYGRFTSIFNLVNNAVDDTSYTPWELGYERETTNDEYRQKYQNLYGQTSEYETVYRIKTTDGLHPHITTLVPVKDSGGGTAALLCIQRPMRELHDARHPYLVNVLVTTVLLAIITSFLAAYYIRNRFVTPLRQVSAEAARFAKENIKGEELGAISPFRELSDLALSIDTMETDMLNYVDHLTAATAEKERIGVELSLAGKIQADAIPNRFPAFPERTDIDIYGSMTPAKEVGGDFYNFFLVDSDHLAMIIADVSGKSVPAALFMMVTDILISDRVRMGGTPAQILSSVNHDLCEHNDADMFVTVWLGILELSTGKLTAANAGHEYPVLTGPDGSFEILKDKHGLALGALDGVQYKGYELQLQPGSKLFVYTDGVPEAADPDQNMFGLDRMIAALNEQKDASPEDVLNGVRRAVDGFVRGAEQFDDLTMLCVEYKG